MVVERTSKYLYICAKRQVCWLYDSTCGTFCRIFLSAFGSAKGRKSLPGWIQTTKLQTTAMKQKRTKQKRTPQRHRRSRPRPMAAERTCHVVMPWNASSVEFSGCAGIMERSFTAVLYCIIHTERSFAASVCLLIDPCPRPFGK